MRLLLATLFCALAASASAQPFPAKPIRIVVPGPPGSSLDAAARELAQKLPELWGQPVVVEHRPGAGSGIGAEHVAKSAPDGTTWLIAPYNVLTLNRHLYGNPVHPLKEFTPVTRIANVPFVLAVHPSVPANSVGELIALAKASPGQLNYGTSGTGSAQHLAAELFNTHAMVSITGVNYKGGANAITDLLAGRIQVYFGAVNSLLPHIKAGKLKALAAASARRGKVTADMPTIAESGLPGFDVPTWNAVVLPAGVPAEIVKQVHAGAIAVFNAPEVRDRLAQQGIEIDTNTPEELAAHITKEYAMLGQLVKDAGIKPQ